MNAEWDVAFLLSSPFGGSGSGAATLAINTSNLNPALAGHRFVLDHQKCNAGPFPLRVPFISKPQRSGSIMQRQFRPGYVHHLAVELWTTDGYGDDKPAWFQDRREMVDLLSGHLHAMESVPPSGEVQRLQWTPSGAADRMIDKARLLDGPHVSDDGMVTVVEFDLHSPFPYEMDVTETTTGLGATITNLGTSEYLPMFVIGSSSAFTIENVTTGKKIVYSDALPGASPVTGPATLDCFTETFVLSDGTTLKAGIDMEQTDFFSLATGPNVLTVTGATADVLWRNAWA